MRAPAIHSLPRVNASFFAIVLGLAGLANAWRAAHALWSLPAAIGEVLYAASFFTWLFLAVLYGLKWMIFPVGAKEEASDSVQSCFIGLGGVATMLVAQGLLPYLRINAIIIFLLGAAFTIFFAVWRTGDLWRGERDPAATTPLLYLPVVAGGFVTCNVAVALGWETFAEIAFGAGFFTWLAIESVLLHRLYTGAMLTPALRPTLGIQLAPPAVGAVCCLSLGGADANMVAIMLVGYALFQALLLIRVARWITEAPFAPSYWTVTFGATALASAAIRLSMGDNGGAIASLAPLLFALANLTVMAIAAGTVRLIIQGRLFPPDVSPAMKAHPSPWTGGTGCPDALDVNVSKSARFNKQGRYQ